ncbi:hypothetical protein RU98_GL001403 [Enterococcus caccae]|nr:hypothetical protein RU98_GL001403 [Enterococcus caccae]
MASPIEVIKNGEKWFYLNQNDTKQIEVIEQECTIQAKFFFLKSAPFTLIDKGQVINLEITMNPILIFVYVILFGGMFLIPILHLNIGGILIVLVLYFIFVCSLLNKAYVIKEKT